MLGRSPRHHNSGGNRGHRILCIRAVAVAFPHIGYRATPSNIRFMIQIFLFDMVVQYADKYFRKTQGIDIELAFKQIPPE